jgi:hypothetical protein
MRLNHAMQRTFDRQGELAEQNERKKVPSQEN